MSVAPVYRGQMYQGTAQLIQETLDAAKADIITAEDAELVVDALRVARRLADLAVEGVRTPGPRRQRRSTLVLIDMRRFPSWDFREDETAVLS